jgi:hypothetical protein
MIVWGPPNHHSACLSIVPYANYPFFFPFRPLCLVGFGLLVCWTHVLSLLFQCMLVCKSTIFVRFSVLAPESRHIRSSLPSVIQTPHNSLFSTTWFTIQNTRSAAWNMSPRPSQPLCPDLWYRVKLAFGIFFPPTFRLMFFYPWSVVLSLCHSLALKLCWSCPNDGGFRAQPQLCMWS